MATHARLLPGELQASLEEAVIASPNCVQLAPRPEAAYRERLISIDRSIAELFHVNSRLRRQGSENVPADAGVLPNVRNWYHDTAYRPVLEDLDLDEARRLGIRKAVGELDGVAARLVQALREMDMPALTYAVDIWLILEGRACRLPSQLDALWLERELGSGELRELHSALVGLPIPVVRDTSVIGFLAMTPWRYALFQGPRGYRHALVEVGRVLMALAQVTPTHRLQLDWTLDFFDCELERLLGLDGVERTIGAAFIVNERAESTDDNIR